MELFNRETTNIQELPPIEHPSMHPREKPLKNYLEISAQQKYLARQKRIETANKQNTASMNLRAIQEGAPEAVPFVNMKFKDAKYADPFQEMDPHAPKRSFNDASPM